MNSFCTFTLQPIASCIFDNFQVKSSKMFLTHSLLELFCFFPRILSFLISGRKIPEGNSFLFMFISSLYFFLWLFHFLFGFFGSIHFLQAKFGHLYSFAYNYVPALERRFRSIFRGRDRVGCLNNYRKGSGSVILNSQSSDLVWVHFGPSSFNEYIYIMTETEMLFKIKVYYDDKTKK